MDIKKLYEKVIHSEEVHDIPLVHILAVLNAVMEVIGSGECFYTNEQEIDMNISNLMGNPMIMKAMGAMMRGESPIHCGRGCGTSATNPVKQTVVTCLLIRLSGVRIPRVSQAENL